MKKLLLFSLTIIIVCSVLHYANQQLTSSVEELKKMSIFDNSQNLKTPAEIKETTLLGRELTLEELTDMMAELKKNTKLQL